MEEFIGAPSIHGVYQHAKNPEILGLVEMVYVNDDGVAVVEFRSIFKNVPSGQTSHHHVMSVELFRRWHVMPRNGNE